MNSIEKLMADRVLRTIEVDNQQATEMFYKQYLIYTRDILKEFNVDLQNEVMFKYAEYVTRDIIEEKGNE